VHLWRAALPDRLEAARARRLPATRAQALAARAALRGVLGACLGEDPRRVPLLEGPGKPRLEGDLEFSLSHSSGLALLAVGRSVRVGADVERERAVPYLRELVERFFGEEERGRLRELQGAERRRCFFRLWTRREAAAKALGLGILEFFQRYPRWDPERGFGEWRLFDLRPARGCAGAVCREGTGAIAGFWLWREP
jgi:4'-phosphopantetheinyl transferase